MLAVHRSPRETRFLLHSRDTALFHDQLGPVGNSFFSDASFKDLLDKTIQLQPYHPENEEYGSKWYNVMRYALSIMMATDGKSLNTTQPGTALRESMKTLLSFFNHSGFLGDQLDDTMEPILFSEESERDAYFHASFEVIYVLFTYAKRFEEETRKKPQGSKHLTEKDTLFEILQCVKAISAQLTEQPKAQEVGYFHRTTRVLKETMPLNIHIDTSNICLIEDEWLHNYPEFLSALQFEISPMEPDCEKHTETNLEDQTNTVKIAVVADAMRQKQYGRRHNSAKAHGERP